MTEKLAAFQLSSFNRITFSAEFKFSNGDSFIILDPRPNKEIDEYGWDPGSVYKHEPMLGIIDAKLMLSDYKDICFLSLGMVGQVI